MQEVIFLEANDIYLRPVLPEDLNGSYVRWINDVANDQFTEHAQFPHSLDELNNFAQNKWQDRSCIWLAIINKKTKEHIGNLELSNIDWIHRKCEFKIIIDKDNHSKGYGTQAAKLILRHAFGTLNLHRVYLSVSEDNKKAIGLYEKLGFTQEGKIREGLLRNAKWHNIVFMGILESELKD